MKLTWVRCMILAILRGCWSLESAHFDFNMLSTQSEGDSPENLALYHAYDGQRISSWHDIPFSTLDEDTGEQLLSFVCEIPTGTRRKFEIHKSVAHNAIIQDRKNGKLRSYQYGDSIVDYGAIAQTWEDPLQVHPDTGYGGDNDPIDVLQINSRPCVTGEVMPVRVLGCLALVDDDETDWKLIVVDANDPQTLGVTDISQVPVVMIDEMREWFRRYKTAEGKGLNKFGLDEKVMDKDYAIQVAVETHEAWRRLTSNQVKCEFNGVECWLPEWAKGDASSDL